MKSYKEFIEESSSRLKSKFIKLVEPKAKADAIVAQYKGNKPEQDKADKTLKLVGKIKNKLDLTKSVYESIESDYQNLDNHVTTTIPTQQNITKMHDMVHKIATNTNVSHGTIYDKISGNALAHQKYKEAASE
jgi:hypothetical protein